MSFILDALKKSESERQRQSAPGIADLAQAAPGKSPRRWLWIVGGLMVINLAVLAGLLLQARRPEAPTPIVSAATPVAEVAPASDVTGSARPAPRVAEPVPTPQLSPSPAQEQATMAAQVQRETVPVATATPATVTDGPRSFNELRANGELSLPELHLDIHVYSSTPADRFVFVNMSKYRENATLTEGPRVAEITPDGVVLEYGGLEFLLPRE